MHLYANNVGPKSEADELRILERNYDLLHLIPVLFLYPAVYAQAYIIWIIE